MADDPAVVGAVSGPPPPDPVAAVSLGCRVLGAEDQSDLVWGHLSVWDYLVRRGSREGGRHDRP